MNRTRLKRRRVRADDDDDDDADTTNDSIVQIRNTVFFYCEVSRQQILVFIQKLEDASTYALTNRLKEVVLYIHSNGGDVHAGLSAMDHISNNCVPIRTVADGFVASAATLMLLAGSTRCGLPHSTILIHQLSTGFWGKYEVLKDELENSEQLMEILRRLYTEKTNMSKKKVNNLLKKELTLSHADCLKHGIYEFWA